MRIDLHTHSDRSDGTTSPREVVLAAAAAGLDVVALTDHDTAEGWAEAEVAAGEAGIGFVPGIEVSCKHAGRGLHLLAYLPDSSYPPLQEALRLILEGRDQRMPRICERLRELGIGIHEAAVARQAVGAVAIGRPHIADAMVELGVVKDRTQAFDDYLSPGRPAYVHRCAAPVEEMIPLLREAGGVPVIAHPWGRHDNATLQEEALAALVELGLGGIEVDHQDHDEISRKELRGIAANLGLVVTGSSDFHGAGKVDHDLGCNTTEPAQLERLLSLAASTSAASGRRTPTALLPC